MKDAERQAVLLSALLHDIGKLLQRAAVRPDGAFDADFWLQELCHRQQGYYTYRHAMLTRYFIEQWLPEPLGKIEKEGGFHLAAYHRHLSCPSNYIWT